MTFIVEERNNEDMFIAHAGVYNAFINVIARTGFRRYPRKDNIRGSLASLESSEMV